MTVITGHTHRRWASPLGELTIVIDAQEKLLGIYYPNHRPTPNQDFGRPDATACQRVVDQLAEYFAGHRSRFELPLASQGTQFQQEVWAAIAAIDYGHTSSYGEVARQLGRPEASRAVANATSRNPWSIVVPCHRLIGADGSLTGYAGGIAAKRFLLELEAATALANNG